MYCTREGHKDSQSVITAHKLFKIHVEESANSNTIISGSIWGPSHELDKILNNEEVSSQSNYGRHDTDERGLWFGFKSN